MIDVRIPDLGDGVTEATIVTWLKHPGESVQKGEIIAEIMTDKVNIEVECPESGVLEAVLAQPDETVAVGTVIARIALGP